MRHEDPTATGGRSDLGEDLAVPSVEAQRYVGLTTRTIAFVVDAALINVVAIIVDIGARLVLSVLQLSGRRDPATVAVGGTAYAIWTVGYFVAFWSGLGAGQTPGNRLMRFRVVAANGGEIRPARALLRCFGLLLAALPLFAGYVLIIFDRRRRGLQDFIARTLVIDAPAPSVAEQRRMRRRTSRTATDGRLAYSSDSGDAGAIPGPEALSHRQSRGVLDAPASIGRSY